MGKPDIDILIDGETGEMQFVTFQELPGERLIFSRRPVPPDNETRMARDLGLKVLKYVEEGMAVGDICITGTNMVEEYSIILPVVPKKPEPLKGLKWLMTQPEGTRLLSPVSHMRVIIVDGGVFIMGNQRFLTWDEMLNNWYTACPETCPTWEPVAPE